MLDTQKTGLALGLFLAVVHAAWQVLVWLGSAQSLIGWMVKLHSIKMSITVLPFSLTVAVSLIVVTFAVGYVFGWVFALIWNKVRN